MNIKEFAKLTGYSTATVSRVLNGKNCVSKETREKILKLQKKYNFYLNRVGKALSTKKTNIIGVTLPHLNNVPSFEDIFFPSVVKGMEDILAENGYDLLLLTSYELGKNKNNYIRLFKEKLIDGLILMNVKKDDRGLKELEESIYPYVCIGKVHESNKGSYVDTDNIKRGYIGTEHLIKEHNLRKIGYIGGELNYLFNLDHFNGYKLALINNNIEIEDEIIKTVSQSTEEGYKGMRELIKEGIEGVILFGNLITIGAIEYIKEKKIKIPDDLKIIITSEFLPFYKPDIIFTQVQQDVSGLGEMAVKILIEEIESGKRKKRQIILQPKFIKGNSCGCEIQDIRGYDNETRLSSPV